MRFTSMLFKQSEIFECFHKNLSENKKFPESGGYSTADSVFCKSAKFSSGFLQISTEKEKGKCYWC